VKTVRKEEQAEARETAVRSKNIIIHGPPDARDNQEDQNFVASLIEDLIIRTLQLNKASESTN